jgi:hypothetical protein
MAFTAAHAQSSTTTTPGIAIGLQEQAQANFDAHCGVLLR